MIIKMHDCKERLGICNNATASEQFELIKGMFQIPSRLPAANARRQSETRQTDCISIDGKRRKTNRNCRVFTLYCICMCALDLLLIEAT